jgi:hypothetical protein
VTIVRVGTTKKYAENWGSIFGGGKSAKSAKKVEAAAPAKSTPSKKAAPKKGKKK